MTTQDLSNLVINGRFLLQRRVGVGGMATVYAALDTELDKRVAVKVLNPEWRQDEDQVGRFRQEARTAAKLQHPHLVDVTDRGISREGIPYLVMEFLEGKSLQQEMFERPGPMPWRRVVEIVVQVCAALTVAHENGLVHRDIKPGNCFLVARPGQAGDFVKVLDLGIAKVVAGPRDPYAPPSTRTGQGTPGTPEYMSPEQIMGNLSDGRSDLYSLGIMTWSMLAGRLPFSAPRGEPPWTILEKHIHYDPPGLREAAPEAEIPESIEQIVLRCLAKLPDDRWSSALELAMALRTAEEVELARMAVGPGHTVVDVPRYRRASPADTRVRRLRRVLMVLQSGVLFSLSAMALLLVDLPGVEALAGWLRDDAPLPSRPAQRRAVAAPEAAAPPSPPWPAEPAPPPGPAEPSPSPVAHAPDTPQPAVEPSIALDGPHAPRRPEPGKPGVVDPFAGENQGLRRSEVADPFAKDQAYPFPLGPHAAVQAHVGRQKGKLRECADYLDGEHATLEVRLTLAARTGKVLDVEVLKGVRPLVDNCVRRILGASTARRVSLGGEYRAKVEL